MKYYLVNDRSGVIKIYFEEPADASIRCYGFENFVSIPTRYASYSKGILDCGDEMRDIIASYYFNGILPCTGKQNGSVITPIECDKNDYLNRVIDSIKKKDEEDLRYLTRFFSSPCRNHVGIQDKDLDRIINYLMILYRSDMFRGTVILASKKYTKNSEVLNSSNFNSLKNSEIVNIIKYCINNDICIKTFVGIVSMMEEGTLDEFQNIFEKLKSNFDRYKLSIPEYLIIFLLKNTKKENIDSTIEKIINLSDDEIIEMIRSKKDDPEFHSILNYLSEDYIVVQKYIREKLQTLVGNASFVDEPNAKLYEGCYYTPIEVEENILSELEKDEMLPLFITSGEFNRGPNLSKEYLNKKLLYIGCFGSYTDEFIRDIVE